MGSRSVVHVHCIYYDFGIFSVNMQASEHVSVKDFELLKVLGTGGKISMVILALSHKI